MKPILRVGILNNFNMTNPEFKQLAQYEDKYDIFVNTNAHTEVRGNYPAILTVNPELDKFIKPKGKLSVVKAVRVKYCSGATTKVQKAFDDAVSWAKQHNIPVLVTFMRFKSKADLFKYTDDQSNYSWKANYFRQKKLMNWPDDPSMHRCDGKEKGCPSCKNCAKLTFNKNTDDLWGINLSASGVCPYNCPSCYAKNISRFCGLSFDKPSQNAKQKGKGKKK